MSKRNKKFRSNRSALKLEALEQRQLLATIVSGGDASNEKLSNVSVLDSAGNTNVFDQVVMTGSSIAVKADGSQVVRVDWLDADGDIVRAEFSGSGTMAINLAGASTSAKLADKYTTTNTYMQGLATITITGSAADTNLQLYSLGKGTAFNGAANPLFADATKVGGSHQMDIAAVVALADNTTVGNSFGSIRAANVVFGASEGVVGIAADNINFRGVVTIGDIDAKGTATPVVKVGQYSDVKKVTIAGGDLKQTGGATVAWTNVNTWTVQNNVDSNGTAMETLVLDGKAGVVGSAVTYSSGTGALEIDGSKITQTELDAYKGKYLDSVTIKNGLASGLVFRALQFGNITVEGNLAGLITTDVNDKNDADAGEQSIGNVLIKGDVLQGGGIESSQSIGTITVEKGVTHTAKFGNGAGDNILAKGVFTTIGKTSGDSSIGAVNITGAVALGTATTADAEHFIYAGLVGPTVKQANVGQVTIGGDLKAYLTGAGNAAVSARGLTAKIAGVAVTGDVLLNSDAATALISTGAAGANIKNTIGDISGKSITLSTAAGAGSAGIASTDALGNITSTGSIVLNANAEITAVGIGAIKAGTNLTLGDQVNAGAGALTSITLTEGNWTGAGAVSAKTIGDITVSKGSFNNGGTISAESIGNLKFSEGAVTIGAAITATEGNIGDITVTKGNLTVTASVTSDKKSIGNITVGSGDVSITGGQFKAAKGQIGNIDVTGSIASTTVGAVEFTANKIGDIKVMGKAATTTLLTDVIFQAKGTDGDTIKTASIGNITLNTAANGGAVIATSTAASTTEFTGTGFSSSRNIGNVTIFGEGQLLSGANAALVIRAGSSNMGALDGVTIGTPATLAASAATAVANGSAVSEANGATSANAVESVTIGNVSITANMAQISKNAAGKGLIVAAGVNVVTDGTFSTAAVNPGNLATVAKLTSGTIGDVALTDTRGGMIRSAFNSATLQNAVAVADAGTSIIIADKINGLKVLNGAGSVIDLKDLTGLQLKGALGTAGLDPTQIAPQQYTPAAGANDNLLVVVL